jgi:two-component system KDP operon response regulator KdpE
MKCTSTVSLQGEVTPTPTDTPVAADTPNNEEARSLGALRVEFTKRQVILRNQPRRLTPLGFKVLVYLARHAGRAVTPSELLREVWGCRLPPRGSEAAVRKAINRLRHKIELDPRQPQYVRGVRGYGCYLPASLRIELISGDKASEHSENR